MTPNGISCWTILLGALIAESAMPQSRLFEEFHRMLPPLPGDTRDLAVGDIDGDGDADLLLAWFNEGCHLRINTGSGAFRTAPDRWPTLRIRPTAVELADLDGDQDLDAVIGTGDPARNWILENDGNGAFQIAATALPITPDSTLSLVVGDVDGDLDVDILFGNSGPNRLLLNDGTGTFVDASARIPSAALSTWALALVDVDGDHDLDIIAGNDIGEPNGLYINDGLGNFRDASANLPAHFDRTRDIAFGDVDGDRDLDLLFATSWGQCHLYLNNGSGAFSDASAALPTRSDPSQAVAFGDVDGDGDLDAYIGNGGPSTPFRDRLLLGDGVGSFADASSRLPARADQSSVVRLADVDGDADLDALLGTGWSDQEDDVLLLNDGSGNFVDTRPPTGFDPLVWHDARDLQLVDVDSDGDLDLVALYDGPNRLFRNDGTGSYVEDPAALPLDSDLSNSLAAGDVDGDGDIDLLVGNDGRDRLYLNTGSGVFSEAPANLPAAQDTTLEVALADIDRDADLDFFCANVGQNRLFLNQGDGRFLDGTTHLPADSDTTNCVAFGDLNGDGYPDLLVGNHAQFGRLYLNDGAGSFFDATATHLPPVLQNQTADAALLDRDQDGDLDIMLLHFLGSSRLNFLENDGSGRFSDQGQVLPTLQIAGSTRMATGDFDADGDPDLYFANWQSQSWTRNLLWRNDRAAGFTDISARLPSCDHGRSHVVAGDIDGDLDLDLVIGGGGSIRIYANLSEQVGWRAWPRIHKPFEFELFGAPFASWALYVSTGVAPVPIPGLGTLGIDLSTAILAFSGVHDSSGRAQISLTVPDDILFVDTTLWWQVACTPPKLSNLERTTISGL